MLKCVTIFSPTIIFEEILQPISNSYH